MPTTDQIMPEPSSPAPLLEVAIAEAEQGYLEGGVPIGAAISTSSGELLGKGRNRLVQDGDPTAHAEVDALRQVGRRGHFDDLIMATTLMPCWMCAGMIKQFRISKVLVGDRINFDAGTGELLQNAGVEVVIVNDRRPIELLKRFIAERPDLLLEDAGGQLDN